MDVLVHTIPRIWSTERPDWQFISFDLHNDTHLGRFDSVMILWSQSPIPFSSMKYIVDHTHIHMPGFAYALRHNHNDVYFLLAIFCFYLSSYFPRLLIKPFFTLNKCWFCRIVQVHKSYFIKIGINGINNVVMEWQPLPQVEILLLVIHFIVYIKYTTEMYWRYTLYFLATVVFFSLHICATCTFSLLSSGVGWFSLLSAVFGICIRQQRSIYCWKGDLCVSANVLSRYTPWHGEGGWQKRING